MLRGATYRFTAEPISVPSGFTPWATCGLSTLVGSVVGRRRGKQTRSESARRRRIWKLLLVSASQGSVPAQPPQPRSDRRLAGVASGPLHSLSPVTHISPYLLPGDGTSRASARAFYPLSSAIPQGAARPGWIHRAFPGDAIQSGTHDSLNDARDDNAKRLPISLGAIRDHAEMVELGFYQNGEWSYAGTGHDMFEDWRIPDDLPTHWMPLPEPPK